MRRHTQAALPSPPLASMDFIPSSCPEGSHGLERAVRSRSGSYENTLQILGDRRHRESQFVVRAAAFPMDGCPQIRCISSMFGTI